MDRLLRTTLAASEPALPAASASARPVGPRAPTERSEGARTSAKPDPISGLYVVGPSRGAIGVLVVSDDPDGAVSTRRSLRRGLTRRSRIRIASGPAETVAALEAEPFDVVVLLAPGAEPQRALAELIAASRSYGSPAIVVLGTEIDAEVAADACARGAQDFLVLDEASDAALTRAVLCARARAECTRALVEDAQLDELTRLPTRGRLGDRFGERRLEAQRRGESIAMLLVDVDRFKDVNDRHGHVVGDRVLAAMAERIVSSVRASDLVARLGGDEFAVLLDSIGEEALRELVHRVERTLEEPVEVGEGSVTISASVGYAIGSAEETPELSALALRADAEMYRRKRRGSR